MPEEKTNSKALIIFIYLLAAIGLLGTFLPLLDLQSWTIRVFDFPKLQLFSINLLALALALFLYFMYSRKAWHFVVIFLLLAAMGYQAYQIYPYTPMATEQVLQLPPDQEEEAQQLALLVSNVYQYNEEYGRLLQQIEDWQPDVVLTMETDQKWQQALSVLKGAYPHTVEVPLDNTYGMLLHSRLPLLDPQVHYLVEDDVPSIITRMRLPSGQEVQLYCVHPRPPVPTEQEGSEERDAEIVLIGKKAKRSELPVVVAGDFNDVAWSPTTRLFQEVSGLLDPRIGRGYYNTFNANYWFLRWPLDYVFQSDDFLLVEIERLPHIGSDHFPIYIRLQLDARGPQLQQGPEPNQETIEEAEDMVENGH